MYDIIQSHHFQQYFSYIMVVVLIGGGNRLKSLTDLITESFIENKYVTMIPKIQCVNRSP